MASNASAMAHGLGMHGTAGCLKSGVGDASDVACSQGSDLAGVVNFTHDEQ